ncbi:MAG TPA: hypothetical protein VGU02_08100, partial [Gaiellaceae bacterium]|nr:hypothetical protein [Gaiellaceae bacterium]
MSHRRDSSGAVLCEHDEHEHEARAGLKQTARDSHHHDQAHDGHEHGRGEDGHSHGLVDRSILRSRDGVKTVSISLVVLTVAAVVQTIIFIASGSVAL